VLTDIANRISESNGAPANTTYPAVQFMLSHLPMDKVTGPYALLALGLFYPVAIIVGALLQSTTAILVGLVLPFAFTLAGPLWLRAKARSWASIFEAAAALPEGHGLLGSITSGSTQTWTLLYSEMAISIALMLMASMSYALYFIRLKRSRASEKAIRMVNYIPDTVIESENASIEQEKLMNPASPIKAFEG
jgi:hypothetical protein